MYQTLGCFAHIGITTYNLQTNLRQWNVAKWLQLMAGKVKLFVEAASLYRTGDGGILGTKGEQRGEA